MELLYRIFGPPHEALHVLALWLIGKRAVSATRRHVDIPDDLSTGQYVFVAGLPALVFWSLAAVGITGLTGAQNLLQVIAAFLLTMVAVGGGLGTLGDIQLIILRLMEDQNNRRE
jgi:hypothetical protein